MSENKTFYSVVVPVASRVDDLVAIVNEYASSLQEATVRFEVIVVLDGLKEGLLEKLREYGRSREWLRTIQFSRQFGEAAALMAGFNEARGDVIMTLPAYWQVAPSELPKLIAANGANDDMLIAVRWPRSGTTFERVRRDVFHGILKFITGMQYRDLGCGVRLFKREVAREIPLYGDQYRFLPVLAVRRGFQVREIDLKQSSNDRFKGRYRFREYLHRILDVLTVFFLVRFTKKPLRFFGSIGFIAAGIGIVVVLTLVIQRMFFGMALGDRPALLLGSLLIVLGVQLFGLGLLGELVIYSHAAGTKEYAIRKIVGARERSENSTCAMPPHEDRRTGISG